MSAAPFRSRALVSSREAREDPKERDEESSWELERVQMTDSVDSFGSNPALAIRCRPM